MGWENVFHCEWNPFGQKVLKHYWPEAISYEDITKTDFTIHRGTIDVLTGGFPCQPYSTAGKRLGKEDDRHLWPEMLRAIREIAPRFVVGENVRGLLSWNGGLVFDEVQADLEAQGYEVLPFLLPACGVNAPHRRDRIWFVALNSKCNANGGYIRGESERNGLEMVGNFMDQARWNESSNDIESSSSYVAHTESERGEGLRIGAEQAHTEFGINGNDGIIADAKSNRDSGELRGLEIANDRIGESKEHGEDNSEPSNNGGVWDASNPESWRLEGSGRFAKDKGLEGNVGSICANERACDNIDSNASDARLQRNEYDGTLDEGNGSREPHQSTSELHQSQNWSEFPTEPPICIGNDGVSDESLRQRIREYFDGEITETQITRIIKETESKWREETIKAGGNAIVPQVALQIFKAIQEYEETTRMNTY